MSIKWDTIIIGAGLAGISAASYLALQGQKVLVIEKNQGPGGRVRQLRAGEFTFDMGPSWYWMPDVFERYFHDFGREVGDYYTLERLNPGYRMIFGPQEVLDIPADRESLAATFEQVETGAAAELEAFLMDAEQKYRLSMERFITKPSLSPWEYVDLELLKSLRSMHLLRSMRRHIRRYFRDSRLTMALEFPTLLLGSTPSRTPALYSLMNYADLALGTWYPQGGMSRVVDGMYTLSQELGVSYVFNVQVEKIEVDRGRAVAALVDGERIVADSIIGNGDYHHIEMQLLDPPYRTYEESYWQRRTLSPSSLIFFVGVGRKMPDLAHHTLFFDSDFDQHAAEIYDHPRWPERPQFYVSCTSKTDSTVAPFDAEALFVLIPVAPGLHDNKDTREKYFEQVLSRLEAFTGDSWREQILFKKSYAHTDFIKDYHSFKGNAYGLASTLFQTAFLRPRMQSRRVSNLYYTGQFTVPGPGMPPALLSGKIVAQLAMRNTNHG